MILFLRSSDIGIDSRLRRYCRALRIAGIDFAALFWDRAERSISDPLIPAIRFRSPLAYGSRFGVSLRLILLNLFAIYKGWRMRGHVSLIHAVDLDTAVAAWLLNWLTGIPYIYDVYDNYPESRGITGWKRKPFDWLERKVIARASKVILADEARVRQHRGLDQNRLMIVENVPDLAAMRFAAATRRAPDAPLRIGYLGTLEPRHRGLENVLATVESMPDAELWIGGDGALGEVVEAAAARCERIRLFGPMDHGRGLAMLASCDVVLGLYYADVPNHRFAAPNKYFEHLLLGRPMLTSQGTPPGDKVKLHDTGWAIADGPEALRRVIERIKADPEAVERKGAHAAALWQRDYASYFETAICGNYVAQVRQLTHARPEGQASDFQKWAMALHFG